MVLCTMARSRDRVAQAMDRRHVEVGEQVSTPISVLNLFMAAIGGAALRDRLARHGERRRGAKLALARVNGGLVGREKNSCLDMRTCVLP
jgi:hypothetical protein